MNFARLALFGLSIILLGCDQTNSVPTSTEPQNAALGYHADFKADIQYSGFTPLNQVVLKPYSGELVITSSGTDPSVGLPLVELAPPVQFAMRIEMTGPADTLVEVYYSTNTVPGFVAKHVVSVPVKLGRSVILFEINDPEFAGGLRLDPGQAPGEYILHAIEYFSSGPLSIIKPTPAPTGTR